jgi:signal peptidase II
MQTSRPLRDLARAQLGPWAAAFAVFLGLAAAVIVADQHTKAWIVNSYQVGVPSEILGDWVRIWLSHNTGALFGLFRDQALLFAAFSLLVIGIILWYQARAGGSIVVTVALGLLLGGAIGNLTDRLRYGYVVDFVDIGIGTWRFYTFNVADSAISGAVLLLLLVAVVPGLAGLNRDG